MSSKLLTRDQFRDSTFARDGHRCVVRIDGARCSRSADDAHHIVERKLWGNGGYYLENSASVCEPHHMECEQTLIGCDDLRAWCGIKTVLLPDHFEVDAAYDKWGNPILPNGQRMRGELFDDEGVQKTLAPVLHLFTSRVKYPRTYHVPDSPGATSDDRVMASADFNRIFDAKDVVVTEKMDGECTTLYRDYLHARSLEYQAHESRDWIRALHARVAHEIPETWRICGENLYARHSIAYRNLPSYFMVFSIWDGLRCLPWDETTEWCKMLDLHYVPTLYRGNDFPSSVAWRRTNRGEEIEGWVVRLASDFHYSAFRRSVAKYVRANHVQSGSHWMHGRVIPNGLSTGQNDHG